jgi:hypothetical protein
VCEAAHANTAVGSAFVRIMAGEEDGSQTRLQPCGDSQGGLEASRGSHAAALPYRCPLFARKFSSYTADALLSLFQLDHGLSILHGICPSGTSSSSLDS